MNRIFILLLVLLGLQDAQSQNHNVPFTIELEDITNNSWPGLHSFSFAEWDDYWIFIGGRRNGLHGFFALTGFPESEANDKLWVMDQENGQLWSYPVMDFPDKLRDFLKGTNPQFVQRGQYLYISGGYGKDNISDQFVTFDQMTAIDLSILVPTIIAGNSPLSAFRSIKDSRLKVCGGEMHELGEYLYLVGGHNFNGLYNQHGTPLFTQEYTSEIRKFKIIDDGESLFIEDYSATQNTEFHRRDLSLVNAISNEGEFTLAAFGGVFKPDADEAYLNPIYITKQSIIIDDSYEQKMSQYTCPVIPLFDNTNQIQYHLFFGGISLHYWDEDRQGLQEDPLMPFIDDITAFVRHPDGSSEEYILSEKFDELLGSNAKFIPAKNVPSHSNGVVKYEELSGRTLLGYIYGGIRAVIPNITPSSASNRLFEVYITTPSPIVDTKEVFPDPNIVTIFPNPSSGSLSIHTTDSFIPNKLILQDVAGKNIIRLTGDKEELFSSIQTQWLRLPEGIYFLKLRDEKHEVNKRILKRK